MAGTVLARQPDGASGHPEAKALPDSPGYWWVHVYAKSENKSEGSYSETDWSYLREVKDCYPHKNDEIYYDDGMMLNIQADDNDTPGYKIVGLPIKVFVSQKKQCGLKVEFIKLKESDPFESQQSSSFGGGGFIVIPNGSNYKPEPRVKPKPDVPWSDTPATRKEARQRKIELLEELVEELKKDD